MKDKESIPMILNQVYNDFSNQIVYRKNYTKLSRDHRKIDRNEIKREDFGLAPVTKKVKKERIL